MSELFQNWKRMPIRAQRKLKELKPRLTNLKLISIILMDFAL